MIYVGSESVIQSYCTGGNFEDIYSAEAVECTAINDLNDDVELISQVPVPATESQCTVEVEVKDWEDDVKVVSHQ